MKKLVLVLLLLLMCACSSGSLSSDLDSVFNNIDNVPYYDTNNSLDYYSYYLPSSLYEKEVTSDSLSLTYNNSSIIMNLNIADIINQIYYSDSILNDEGFYNNDYLVYENSGNYITSDEVSKSYIYKLYDYDTTYAMYFKTSDNIFYGNINKGDEKEVTRLLWMLIKSINMDSSLVIANYSSKDTIDYQKKQLDLFNYQMPTSGSLSEMLTDDATIGNEPANEDDTSSDETNSQETQTEETTNNEQIITQEETDVSE